LEIKALEIKAWASWKLEAGDADGFEDRRAQEQFSGARSCFPFPNFQRSIASFCNTRKERRATKKDSYTALGGVGEWFVGSLK
jgi:hypothetical protein